MTAGTYDPIEHAALLEATLDPETSGIVRFRLESTQELGIDGITLDFVGTRVEAR